MQTFARRSLIASVAAAAAFGVMTPTAGAATPPTTGWNNWSCKPSAAHPNPVVLAHGLGGNGTDNFLTLAPTLAAAGYCVYSTTYGGTIFGDLVGGLGAMDKSAATFSTFVDKVLASTGATKVNVVGHSEGTTVPAYYMKFLGGDKKVNRYVGFGANYAGTSLSGLGTLAKALGLQPILNGVGCPACSQFLTGSDFLKKLNDGGVAVPGPQYTNIVTKYDTIVTPYTSGILKAPNVTNVVLQNSCGLDFSGHLGLAIDPNVASLVKYHLDPEHAGKPTCVPFWALGA
ncbi:esterase/lipase family protein [Luteipulveratus mongoliensis]|uniref:Lipase n=1 Tax=Luteipulveratus mongoliensis TaxID=571913 RepID=A0A0K1JDL2_9MICO|nr:alpha/beta fold hydrolase [Luteipulveratus mongoliensis]AKU14690.1 lipase [Luteipulveratus mongoliensis]